MNNHGTISPQKYNELNHKETVYYTNFTFKLKTLQPSFTLPFSPSVFGWDAKYLRMTHERCFKKHDKAEFFPLFIFMEIAEKTNNEKNKFEESENLQISQKKTQ